MNHPSTPRQIEAQVMLAEIWRTSLEHGGAPNGWIKAWLMLQFGLGHDDQN